MTCGQNWPSNGGSTAGLWATGAHDTRSAGRSPAVRILAQSGEGTQLVREIPPNALKSAIAAGEIVWIDIVRPEESAASLLRQSLDLEPLTIEDVSLPPGCQSSIDFPMREPTSRRSRCSSVA